MPLVEVLFEDLRVGLRAILKSRNFELPAKLPTGIAKEREVVQLLGAYFNMLQRRIPPRVRCVEWSKELKERTDLDADDHAGLAKIGALSTSGGDLNPHQSIKIDDFLYYDGLFDDWGYLHLHYGLPNGGATKPGFVRRSRNVAFVIETDDVLNVIDVLPHGNGAPRPWAMRRLLEIACRNWPDVLPGTVSQMPAGRSPGPTDDDIFNARNGGVNALVPIDGKMFGGRGISSARISSRVVDKAFAVQRWVRQAADGGEKRAAELLAAVCRRTGKEISELKLRLRVAEVDWALELAIYEEHTGEILCDEPFSRPR